MKKDTLSIAHWALNLSHPVRSVEEWCQRVEKVMNMAARKGCDIVILPEYASEHWMNLAPPGIVPVRELAWQAARAQEVIPRLQAAARKTGVAIVAGSMPWPAPRKKGRFVNRSWMLFPDRKAVHHDKLVLIPSEMDPRGWDVEKGRTVRVFRWRGFSMAILVCLDIEMPALSHLIADKDIDLVLVPSFTEKQSGYYRVFNCARARAVELMTAISVVGCIGGTIRGGARRTQCWSGAAVYVPSEQALGHSGIFRDMPLHGADKGMGRILWAKDIPVGKIRDIRQNGPEAWPGPWGVKGIRVERV